MKPIISSKLKHRFCKDCGISINIFNEPYFTERLQLFNCYEQWKDFLNLLETRFNYDEERYYQEYNNVKELIIQNIKESSAFKQLNSEDMNKYAVRDNFRQKDIYKQIFIGRKIVSIDIKKANFSTLVFYSKQSTDIKFFDSYEWQDYMKQFTDIEHFITSKYIRQVVFGNCNPKRQVTYQKYVMKNILDILANECNIAVDTDVIALHNDEIIIDVTEYTNENIAILQEEVEKCSKDIIPLTFEHFELLRFNSSDTYIKVFIDDKLNRDYELKCVTPADLVFITRFMREEPISENDKVFISDNRLCKYLEVPEFSYIIK